MKILTKKKQKRLMFDLLDIFLMGSDALKAVGTGQPMDPAQALQRQMKMRASGKAERGCAVCPQRRNIPHLTIVSENATADTPRECREMGSAIRTPLPFFRRYFF